MTRRRLTPQAIAHQNRAKMRGTLQFTASRDDAELALQIATRRHPRKIDLLLIGLLQRAWAGPTEVYETKGGSIMLKLPMDRARAAELFGFRPVPEACARCEGSGQARIDLSEDDDAESWAKDESGRFTIKTCPACLGSGRAALLDTDDTEETTS